MIALAADAQALSDEALADALRARGVSGAGIRDFFDLADALLTPDSVQAALAPFDRTRLAVLAVAGELSDAERPAAGQDVAAVPVHAVAQRLSELRRSTISEQEVRSHAEAAAALLLCGLTPDGIVAYRGVTDQLGRWPQLGLPDTASLAGPLPPSPVHAAGVDTRIVDRLAAEQAFRSLSAIVELIGALDVDSARELGKGGLSLPDSKRLATRMGVPLERVPDLLRVAWRAGLVDRSGALWLPTATGTDWVLLSTPERWESLAAAWYRALPLDVHRILADARVPWGALRATVAWLYPAAGESIQTRIDEFASDAELLGVTAGGTPSAIGHALVTGRVDAAREALVPLLPPEVSSVYLQHDLTVISPGPLAPAVDARLRTFAEVESRELASSYRITSASLGRALAAGETAASLLEFLRGISLTGMPQPLEYLITETAARHGRVRVGAGVDGEEKRSYVRSDDESILGQILVDTSLSVLSLRRDAADRLTSRFEPSVVYWAIHDARYPVIAEDAARQVVHLARKVAHRPAPDERPDPVLALVVRLRAFDADMGETGQAWLARQIEIAIREKRSLVVTVSMPGGSTADYLLEPTAVANGRMRARDRRADIERTLPLSAIAGVRAE
ncbi:helicase-associated domain-containing protein [Glaciibacter flavus]|uniref:helicase-associated domain-containing protein n=1 Tax=Orlajensenia flava TaxID=2565934 RepID=UPI003B008C81